MERYKLRFSVKAYKDLADIYDYTNDIWQDPKRAKKNYERIRDEIKKLEYLPKRHPLIRIEEILYNLRLLVIDDYIAFYAVSDDKKIVSIKRILYGASDWSKKI